MGYKNRLQELLDLFDISAAEMSRATGIPKSSISMWINGKREMRQDKIGIICDHYHVNPSWLMGFDSPMHRSTEEAIEQLRMLSGERQELLSPTEAELIDAFREADKYVRIAVLNMLKLERRADAIKKEPDDPCGIESNIG